jgi:acyl carrier protein
LHRAGVVFVIFPRLAILGKRDSSCAGKSQVHYSEPLMENIKQQLKSIIVQGLRITDRGPEDLQDDEPLLGGELGIDSIDILQLILEIERHFDIKLVDGEFDKSSWETINTLSATVAAKLAVKDLVPALQV